MQSTSTSDAGDRPSSLLYDLHFDEAHFRSECPAAVSIVEHMKREDPDLRAWINFPLMNESGRTDDFALEHLNRGGTYTDYALRFPSCREVVEKFRDRSMVVTNARIAVLFEQGIFRPHTDSYDSSRFLIPLNQHDTDFRHIVDPTCFLMRAGELWWIDGRSLHGAANVRDREKRVMLLIDVTSTSAREALGPSQPIPADHLCERKPWTTDSKAELFGKLESVAGAWSFDALERELLMIPFLYDLDVARAYAEIAAFCDVIGSGQAPDDVRKHFAALGKALRNPSLPFQVAASGFDALT